MQGPSRGPEPRPASWLRGRGCSKPGLFTLKQLAWPVPLLTHHALCVQYGFVQAVDIEAIDMGTRPLAVGGVKVPSLTPDV